MKQSKRAGIHPVKKLERSDLVVTELQAKKRGPDTGPASTAYCL